MAKLKTVGIRTTRLLAGKLEDKYLRSRARKPYKTFVKRFRNKWAVKVQEYK